MAADVMQGVIQHATINNLAFGRSVDETLRILQAIQYVQENPDEVCTCSLVFLREKLEISPQGSLLKISISRNPFFFWPFDEVYFLL